MKVTLINPPDDLESVIGAGTNLVTPFEPLGLLYIAAVVRDAGHEVSVIDAYVERLKSEQIMSRVKATNPDVIGMTTFTSNGAIIHALGQTIRRELPHTKVVFGNVHAGIYAKQYLQEGCCDLVVHGEGEFTFLEILKAFEENKDDYSHIPAVSFIRNGEYCNTGKVQHISNLEIIPFPARDLVDRSLYKTPEFNILPADGDIIGKHMFTSRGCPYRCTFCVVHNDKKPRNNEISRAVDEMEMLIQEYQANYLFFMDSLFISNKKRVIALCEEMKRRHLNIRWGCEAHVRYIDKELVENMADAGCHDMSFGIESGVQRLLDNVKKGTTIKRIEHGIRTVKNHSGIKVSGLFIIGLPGETEEDTLETIKFATKLPLDTAQFSILVPYPGSPLFNELAEKGELNTGIRPDGTLDTSAWMRYSSYISYTDNDPIWVTPGMTGEQLKRLQKKAARSFYFRPRAFYNQAKRIKVSQLPKVAKTFIETFF